MHRRFLKQFILRVALGVLLAIGAGFLRTATVSAWPSFEQAIEVILGVAIAVLLYAAVFRPILNYIKQSKLEAKDVRTDSSSAT